MAKYAEASTDFSRLGLFPAALDGISLAQQEEALAYACTLAESYFNERYSLPLVWSFLALASRGASGAGSAIDIFEAERLPLALDLESIDEGTTITVTIEESTDGITGFAALGSFIVASAAGHYTAELKATKQYIRVAYTITGGGAAVFGVSFSGDDLKAHVCSLAAFQLLSARGLDVSGRDEILNIRKKDALDWLGKISSGRVNPGFIDQTPATEEARPVVYSTRRRR